jgi:selenocysteine-specific elongation factor
MAVIATAGHVDHGKSTLVLALTGVDPDRLPEEQTRGMTIDLGFAHTTLKSGRQVSFIDVPGHGRFVKNMLAGVTGVDGVLFVVAATEGWKAQSEEHLAILELTGAPSGVVAFTKVAGVPGAQLEAVVADCRRFLSDSFLADADIVFVDVPHNVGLPELQDALDRLVGQVAAPVDCRRPRLWIDRSFSVRGTGTVVTGTLNDGPLAVGDVVAVQPGRRPVRIRGLQSNGRPLSDAQPGCRLAVNLADTAATEVRRGQAVVRPDEWHLTRTFDASLRVLRSVTHEISQKGAFTVHIGTSAVPVRIRLIGEETRLTAGEEGFVRVWMQRGSTLPLVPGDRYILREAGRAETVGGGEVLDVDPLLGAKRAMPSKSAERVVSERGWVDVDELQRLTGQTVAPNAGRWVVDPAVLAGQREDLKARCRAAGRSGLDTATLDDLQRAILDLGVDGVRMAHGRAVDESSSEELSPDETRVLRILESSPWDPPDLPLGDRGALRRLQRLGLVVESESIWFATSAVEKAMAVIVGLVRDHQDGFTVAQFRSALGTSRKFALPLLRYADTAGVTKREGDFRKLRHSDR